MLRGHRVWMWAVIAAFGVVAAGCGEAEDTTPPDVTEPSVDHGHDHGHDAPDDDADDAAAPDADDGVARITIEGNDMMQYNIDSFTVEVGQTVELTLDHVGNLPAAAMGHNVVILEQGEDPVAFGQEVMRQDGYADQQYVPEAMRDRVIAFTAMIGGGQSDTIEFTAPEEPGEYPFVCTFPGHPTAMNGVMIVE